MHRIINGKNLLRFLIEKIFKLINNQEFRRKKVIRSKKKKNKKEIAIIAV